MNNKPIKLWLVGGAVRDAFRGVPAKDKDYAVEASSFDAMREFILARGGKIFLETPECLTIRATLPVFGSTDYVLCRKDGEYVDGRRPKEVFVGDIYDDLARRDFTMNAIACDTDDKNIVLDPHNGIQDIKDKLIRCVGNPVRRFAEDKLRPFRALRFHVTLGFVIDLSVREAIRELVLPSQFDSVSTERIREELTKMFEKDSFYSFHLLQNEFPVLGTIVRNRGIWFKPAVKKDLTNKSSVVE